MAASPNGKIKEGLVPLRSWSHPDQRQVRERRGDERRGRRSGSTQAAVTGNLHLAHTVGFGVPCNDGLFVHTDVAPVGWSLALAKSMRFH